MWEKTRRDLNAQTLRLHTDTNDRAQSGATVPDAERKSLPVANRRFNNLLRNRLSGQCSWCNWDVTPTTRYDKAMSTQAEDILLNMKAIETLKGGWLIEVQSVSETQGSDCFLVNAILEQTVGEDGEFVRTRRIGIVLPRKLNTPAAIDSMLFEIRRYIESHDEDGVVDLSGNSPH